MISLLHWDGWKILTSRCCFSGIRQGQDQNYWQQVDSGQWDSWSVWTERGVGKLLSTIPNISGENDGRLIDCYKGRDRRWVKDREVWNAYTEKNRRLNYVRAFLLTFINLWSEPKPNCSLKEWNNEKYIDIWRILKVIKISKISGCRTFLQEINGGISLNVFHLLRKLHCDTLNAVVSFLLTTGT